MNKKNVLYIVEDEKSAQFRYRVYNLMRLFDDDNEWNIKYKLTGEHIDENLLQTTDLIIIERQTAKNRNILRIIDIAHNQKKKVLFDLDDLIFDYKDLLLLMRSTNSKNIIYWLGYFWGIRRIAKKVDGFICTNNFLAEKLKRSFGKPVKVIRNSLNKEQIEISKKLIEKKNVRKIAGSGFSIGYFSGSPTHDRDFAMIEPELVRFLKAYKDTKLKVVGYMDFSNRMRELIDIGRVEVAKPVDYLRLQGLLAKVDVNIAPLVVNDFTNCKSELKYFEAAIVETTTIASPTYAFKKAIKNGKNGFLARPREWHEKIEYLYQHPEENKRIAFEAKKYALKHYYGKEFLDEVEATYGYFVK